MKSFSALSAFLRWVYPAYFFACSDWMIAFAVST
jgi:hypothetical protein